MTKWRDPSECTPPRGSSVQTQSTISPDPAGSAGAGGQRIGRYIKEDVDLASVWMGACEGCREEADTKRLNVGEDDVKVATSFGSRGPVGVFSLYTAC